MALSTRYPFRPIRQQQALPEDGLLNISRNSAANPVNCFLGNTLNKDGCPPAGRAESLAWTSAPRTGSAWRQASSGLWEWGLFLWGSLGDFQQFLESLRVEGDTGWPAELSVPISSDNLVSFTCRSCSLPPPPQIAAGRRVTDWMARSCGQ